MAKSKLVKINEKITEGVVGGFTKINDKFVDQFLTHEGESVADAKKRLKAEQDLREIKQKEEIEKHKTQSKMKISTK